MSIPHYCRGRRELPNGSLAMAKQLADAAKHRRGRYRKIPNRKAGAGHQPLCRKAEYQKAETGEAESQPEMCKRIHLTFDEHARLKGILRFHRHRVSVHLFDLDSIDFSGAAGTPLWKVPNGEITNLPYLEKIAATKAPSSSPRA